MEAEPRASRPHMKNYGVPPGPEGMLPWEWARARLSKSHNYWLTTSGAGVPHTMPVWGVWLAGAWYFGTFLTSRKARNLAENPHCVVCNEDAEEAVILEGVARQLHPSEVPGPLATMYKAKYGWELEGTVFEVRPRVVFAMPEQRFPKNVTRWDFG